MCVIVNVCSQVVTSTGDGLWTDPNIWDTGVVPTTGNAVETVVDHDVMIPGSASVSISNLRIDGSLTVETSATVDIVTDVLTDQWDLQVFGTLVVQDAATLNGTSASNTSFEAGSRYIHLQGPMGFIPYATWSSNSTFEIAGFKTQGYINIAHSDSWKQQFGNVVYNCPEQTTAFVDLNGYLRNVNGNFVIQSTNNQLLRLSTTQNPVITIGGDLIVEGPSKVWFSTTPSNAVVNIQNDFRYRSTSAGISYFTTRGVVAVNVFGDMEMNSPGKIHMATTAADSTGSRQCTLALHGNLTVTAGTILAPPTPGKGRIHFVGTGIQRVVSSSTDTFQGNLDYLVGNGATVSLGNSVLSNTTGTLTVSGKLQVGSSHPGGAIQSIDEGNIQISGERIFESGSTLEYNGEAAQWIGEGHPAMPTVSLICSNPAGLTLLNDIVVGDLYVAEDVNSQSFSISIGGELSVAEDVVFGPENVTMVGGLEQHISAPGATLRNLVVNKSSNSVLLTTPLRISESLLIESPNTTFHTNGNLILLSTSDGPAGTASVGPLPEGSSINGDVTVQRHMAGEGRIYRFISSPTQNATVASLKDDFPVTGIFQDPSTGDGIRSTSPSLYHYDESIGGLQEGWLPYPASGLASQNPLLVGRGYAAFIRNGATSTIWDVTGPLNQGMIELPVSFTPNNEPSNGWNLVGNPYPCAIQWGEIAPEKWNMENISAVIAVYDNGLVNGIYRYWDMDDNYPEITDGRIAPGQSFWVRATGVYPELTIREGAKSLDGATFFKKNLAHIPSFAIHLSRDSLSDVTFFKVRTPSKPGLDNWDGLKLENDNFDISIISSDQKSLAIHATDKMPCDTVVQVHIKDLTPGVYHLGVTTKYEFSRYIYTLIDEFLRTETRLSIDQPFELTVTADPGSFASDRLSLRLVENKPSTDLTVVGPDASCIYNLVNLNIKGAEAGITYSVFDEHLNLLSTVKSNAQGDLQMSLPAHSLSAGEHVLKFKAQSACHVAQLDTSFHITADSTLQVAADSITGCAGSSLVLTASSDKSDAVFAWFSEQDSNETIAIGQRFETPLLYKSKIYYVEAASSSGCKSGRIPVKAVIKIYDPANITVIGDSLLISNYVSNNTWYFQGQKIEHAFNDLLMENLGIYTLEVDTLGCLSIDYYEHVVSGLPEKTDALFMYPNPVTETLYINNISDRILCVEIFNTRGAIVKKLEPYRLENDQYAISVGTLPSGYYMIIVTTLYEEQTFRVIKQ